MLFIELILCAIGVGAAIVVAVGFGRFPGEESVVEIAASFGLLMLLVAVYLRIWYARTQHGGDDRTRLIWYLPAAMALIIAPALVTVAGDASRPWIVDVLLFVLLAYAAALLGVLALLMFLLPLELLGRGALRLITGRPDGGWLLFWGAFGALLTTLILVGAFALDDLPPGRAAMVPVICALLGLPAGYTVESEQLLWLARALVVLLTAMLLASAHFDGVRRDAAVRRTAAARSEDRRQRDDRRRAQLQRDRDLRERR